MREIKFRAWDIEHKRCEGIYWSQCEVIGNIHENPELIKDDEK